MQHTTLLEKVETLQNILIAHATGNGANNDDYRLIREELLADSSIKLLLPRFVATCRDLSQFWSFIKGKFAHYQERREFIWNQFAPLIEKLENRLGSPADSSISNVLAKFDVEQVHQVWQRALERRVEDPDGAITSARTLLESVCKNILDDLNCAYPDDVDLPKLYRLTSEQLNLAPSQHTEKIFKQILGGCQTVVESLGALRNKLGDAHGQGKKSVKPQPRHAELAVNLAGTMATFLVSTWEYQKQKAAYSPTVD